MELLTYIKSFKKLLHIFTKNIFHTYSPVEASDKASFLLSHFNHLNTPNFKIVLLRTLVILPITARKEMSRAVLPCAFIKVNKIILRERDTLKISYSCINLPTNLMGMKSPKFTPR